MDAQACAELGRRSVENLNNRTFDPSLYTPDATMWHNTDGEDAPAASRQEIRDRLLSIVPDFRFDEAVTQGYEDGFVTQYVVRGTLPDGGELRMLACVVGTVRDGKIARIQEYVDSAQVTPLREAFKAKMLAERAAPQ